VETIRQATDEPPARLAQFNPIIGKDLETICLKCLEKSPSSRYSSARELANDLQRWLDHLPVRARPRPLLARVLPWCRRHPAKASSLVAVLALLLVVLTATIISFAKIDAANKRTARLLDLMRYEKAENLFKEDSQNEGLAILAQVLESAPGEHETLARRLKYELSTQRFAIQDARPSRIGQQYVATSLSPDGNTAVTISREGRALRWDLTSGSGGESHLLFQLEKPIYQAAIAPDCRIILMSNFDRELMLWSEHDEEPTIHDLGSVIEFEQPGFNATGQYAIAIVDHRRLQVWDTHAAGELVRDFKSGDILSSWASNPKQRFLVAGTTAGKLMVWNPLSNFLFGQFEGHSGKKLTHATFDASGRHLATATVDGEIKIWNLQNWKNKVMQGRHSAPLTSLSFSPDGTTLASSSHDKSARLWQVESTKELTPPLHHENSVLNAVFSPDGSRIATSSEDGTTRLWDPTTGQPTLPPMRHETGVPQIFFKNNNHQLVTATYGGLLWGWTVIAPYLPPTELQESTGYSKASFLGPNHTHIVGIDPGGEISVWKSDTGQKITTRKIHDSRLASLILAPDKTHFATVSNGRKVLISSLEKDQITSPISLDHSSSVTALNFSSDQIHLATGTQDGRTWIWDWPSQQLIHATPEQEGPIHSIAMAPDNQSYLVGSPYQFSMRNLESGVTLGQPMAFAGILEHAEIFRDKPNLALFTPRRINRLDLNSKATPPPYRTASQIISHHFSSDRTKLLTGCRDGQIQLWNWDDSEKTIPLHSFRMPESITTVCLSHDHSISFTGSENGTYRLWDNASGQALSGLSSLRGKITHAQFSSHESKLIISASHSPTYLLSLASNDRLAPPLISQLLRFVTKTELDENGHPVLISNDHYQKRRESLQSQQITNNTPPLLSHFLRNPN